MTSSFRSARTDRALGASLWHRRLQITGLLHEQLAYHDPGRPSTLAPSSSSWPASTGSGKAGNGQVVATSRLAKPAKPSRRQERPRVPFNRAANEATVGEVETSAPPDNKQQPAATSRSKAPPQAAGNRCLLALSTEFELHGYMPLRFRRRTRSIRGRHRARRSRRAVSWTMAPDHYSARSWSARSWLTIAVILLIILSTSVTAWLLSSAL
jgi:hypothetical protein